MRTALHYLMQFEQAEIFLKREDLLPFSFGGNKVRIAAELFRELEAEGCDAVVSYGSPTSNLNRVVAQLARAKGLSCIIVCKEEGKTFGFSDSCRPPLNLRLVQEAGAQLLVCRPDGVRQAVEEALSRLCRAGKRPYYVYGDSSGSGNEAVLLRAYARAFQEIRAYEQECGQPFSALFLASGTGTTQAGLLLGQAESRRANADGVGDTGGFGKKVLPEVIGISVARGRRQAEESILGKLAKVLPPDLLAAVQPQIHVMDAYLAGGYGQYDERISACIRDMTERFGLPLDPVYTGKAFCGMLQEIHRRQLSGRLLFLHTGGLPIYFDYLAAHML